MRVYKVLLAVLLILLFSVALVSCYEDNGKSIPYFSRMPNYFVSDNMDREFDAYSFSTAEGKVRVEGKKYEAHYLIKDEKPAASPLQIRRNYSNAVQAMGGSVLFDGEDEEGREITTLMVKVGGKELWLEVYVWNQGDSYTVVMIEKEAMLQKVKVGNK